MERLDPEKEDGSAGLERFSRAFDILNNLDSKNYDQLVARVKDSRTLSDFVSIKKERVGEFISAIECFDEGVMEKKIIPYMDEALHLLSAYSTALGSLKKQLNGEFAMNCNNFGSWFPKDRLKSKKRLDEIADDFSSSKEAVGSSGVSSLVINYSIFREETAGIKKALEGMEAEYDSADFRELDELKRFYGRFNAEVAERYRLARKKCRHIAVRTENKHVDDPDLADRIRCFRETLKDHMKNTMGYALEKAAIRKAVGDLEKRISYFSSPSTRMDYVISLASPEKDPYGFLGFFTYNYAKTLLDRFHALESVLSVTLMARKKEVIDMLYDEIKPCTAPDAPLEQKIQFLRDYMNRMMDIYEKANILSNAALKNECGKLIKSAEQEINALQERYDDEKGILRIGDTIITDPKTFSLPKYVGDLECPDDFYCRRIRDIMTGSNGIKEWLERIDRSADVVMEMGAECGPSAVSYLRQVRDGVSIAMKHGYLATRIYGSFERKAVVENFIDVAGQHISNCEKVPV